MLVHVAGHTQDLPVGGRRAVRGGGVTGIDDFRDADGNEIEFPDAPIVDRASLRDDIGNADRFARENGERLRHVAVFNPSWHVWDGRRWAPDTTGLVLHYGKLT